MWEGAELLENFEPSRKTLEVLTDEDHLKKTLTIKNESDLPHLRNPPILIGKNDFTSLSYLHEPAVLYNLQVRYCQNSDIYTYCGIVLVAINPYHELPIYGKYYSQQDTIFQTSFIFMYDFLFFCILHNVSTFVQLCCYSKGHYLESKTWKKVT